MPTSVRRPSSARDDDDDKPRGSARRYAEDEDDAPRSRRRGSLPDRKSRDEDDDDAPRGRGGSRTRSRERDDDDDDDDDKPRSQTAKAKSGWGAFKKGTKENFRNFDFKVGEEDGEVIVKFLDDEPFHSYQRHWFQNRQGRKGFLCLRDLDQDCPLCDAGHDDRSALAAFNVLVLDEKDKPSLMVWSVSGGIATKVEKKASAKTGPLTVHYYSVSKVKPASGTGVARFEFALVREADLRDYDLEPISDKEFEEFDAKRFEADYFKYPTKNELRDIAREWSKDDD